MPIVSPGFYRDEFEPNGPVEVIGEASDSCGGSVRVVVKSPGRDRMELVRPAEFFIPVTVKRGEDEKPVAMLRFTRIDDTQG